MGDDTETDEGPIPERQDVLRTDERSDQDMATIPLDEALASEIKLWADAIHADRHDDEVDHDAEELDRLEERVDFVGVLTAEAASSSDEEFRSNVRKIKAIKSAAKEFAEEPEPPENPDRLEETISWKTRTLPVGPTARDAASDLATVEAETDAGSRELEGAFDIHNIELAPMLPDVPENATPVAVHDSLDDFDAVASKYEEWDEGETVERGPPEW